MPVYFHISTALQDDIENKISSYWPPELALFFTIGVYSVIPEWISFHPEQFGRVSVCIPVHLQGQFAQTLAFVRIQREKKGIQLCFLLHVSVHSHPS